MKNRNRKRRFVAKVESMEERFLLSAAPRFNIQDLGITVMALVGDINQLGQVAGAIEPTDGGPIIVALSGQDGSPLKPLVPVPDPYGSEFGFDFSYGISVNDSSQVLFNAASGESNLHIYSNGVITSINGAMGGMVPGHPLNNAGNVAGTLNDVFHAFFYDGTVHDLGTLGGSHSGANGINDSNQIAGSSSIVGDKFWHAFFYNGTMHDLGTLGGQESEAFSINASGQVVGSWEDFIGQWRAFFSDPNGGTLHDMGLPSGATGDYASEINDRGHIIGQVETTGNSGYPFFYNGGTLIDLNSLISPSSGFNILLARGINNSDQISAYGTDSLGRGHALLLTPIPPVAPTITWANPADIVYGTPISATQLNATANVPGTFTYSVAAGTVLHAGAAQSLVATFTPDDTVNYTTVTATASINVLKAPLTVTANNVQVHYGFQIPPLTGTITGLVNGDTDVATYTTTAVQGSGAAYYAIVPHLTDPNYNITYVNGILLIYWSIPPGW